MYVLEIVTRDYEGTWSNNIVVSKDKNLLLERIPNEKLKYIQEQVEAYEDKSYEARANSLFAIGELEGFIFDKMHEGRKDYVENDNYHIDGYVFNEYKELRDYIISIATPLAEKLGVDLKMIKEIINSGFYESLRFRISEIEEI